MRDNVVCMVLCWKPKEIKETNKQIYTYMLLKNNSEYQWMPCIFVFVVGPSTNMHCALRISSAWNVICDSKNLAMKINNSACVEVSDATVGWPCTTDWRRIAQNRLWDVLRTLFSSMDTTGLVLDGNYMWECRQIWYGQICTNRPAPTCLKMFGFSKILWSLGIMGFPPWWHWMTIIRWTSDGLKPVMADLRPRNSRRPRGRPGQCAGKHYK